MYIWWRMTKLDVLDMYIVLKVNSKHLNFMLFRQNYFWAFASSRKSKKIKFICSTILLCVATKLWKWSSKKTRYANVPLLILMETKFRNMDTCMEKNSTITLLNTIEGFHFKLQIYLANLFKTCLNLNNLILRSNVI